MKSKNLKVAIKSSKQSKSDFLAALKGKRRMIQAENEVVFNSVKSFMRIMTKNRVEILIYLNHHEPQSIYALAKGLGRDFKNVHSDVTKLANMDLILIEKSGNSRRGLVPKSKYTGLELSLIS
jgi:predicted transcriptional regulator